MLKVYDVVAVENLRKDTLYSLVLVNKESGKPYSVWASNNLVFPTVDDNTVVVAVNAPKKDIDAQLNDIFFKDGSFYRTWERYPRRLTIYEKQNTQLYLKAPERKERPVYIEIERDKTIETKTDISGELKYEVKYDDIKDYGDFFKIRVYNDDWGRATTQIAVKSLDEFDYRAIQQKDEKSTAKLEEAVSKILANPKNTDKTANMIKNLLNGLSGLGEDNSVSNLFDITEQLDKDIDENELLKHVQTKVPNLGKMLGEDKDLTEEVKKIAQQEGTEKLDYNTLMKILYKLNNKK
jgi:hypothetical protein